MTTLARLALRELWCTVLALAIGRNVMFWHAGLVMPQRSPCVVCMIRPDEMPEALAAFLQSGMREEWLAMRDLHEKYLDAVQATSQATESLR